jgi:thiamine biosynthesis lipoprotein
MKSSSSNPAVERAQPWLGTLVSIRIEGLPDAPAHAAIECAFEEVATVHRLMSFHEPDSDISRLNREAIHRSVEVHPYTLEVLRSAMKISTETRGCFDISIGAELVKWELLPRPTGTSGLPEGCWKDIELGLDGRVKFHRPVWIDVGGIAKGYAVDRATDRLRERGAVQAVVNAGGDIRVHGEQIEPIRLALNFPVNSIPVLAVADGSIASSSGYLSRRRRDNVFHGPHVHGIQRSPACTERFVCVLAQQCIWADALTKVVMVEGATSAELLGRFGACAHLHDPLTGWQHLNTGTANQ